MSFPNKVTLKIKFVGFSNSRKLYGTAKAVAWRYSGKPRKASIRIANLRYENGKKLLSNIENANHLTSMKNVVFWDVAPSQKTALLIVTAVKTSNPT
jgi:hypothetical protein